MIRRQAGQRGKFKVIAGLGAERRDNQRFPLLSDLVAVPFGGFELLAFRLEGIHMCASRKPTRVQVVVSQTNGSDSANVFPGHRGNCGRSEPIFKGLGDHLVAGSGQCSDGARSVGQELPMRREGVGEPGTLPFGRSLGPGWSICPVGVSAGG